MRSRLAILITAGALALGSSASTLDKPMDFGPNNPFYAPSTLPFHAPPFDKIKESDYQPAIEAGMAEQRREIRAIADNPAPPTFENTFVALEKTGQLFNRAMAAFNGVTGANLNPELQKVQDYEAPRLAAHSDAIYLDSKLFQRVAAIYQQRDSLKLDAEALRLVEFYYKKFVHSGANLSDSDKDALKKLNEEESTLTNDFTTRLLAATKDAAFVTTDKGALAGLTDAQISAAALAAKDRKLEGYVVPLQNTTQQPDLDSLNQRSTRQALFENSWNRAERGGANDTRDIVSRLAQLRAQKAKLLGFPTYAAWKLDDQMAKTPEAALKFMDALVPGATARATAEAGDIQALIDSQKAGFKLEPWDWNFYAEQVRKAKYDMDEAQIKPYFELNNVLENGVFYAASQLYGITFKERKDIPVYNPEVRVFEVIDANGQPLALFYGDYFKRDNKRGGAWMSNFVDQSKLLGTLPVVYNVCNFSKPAPGEPALLSFRDVTTVFHEFGHALHGMLADSQYPTLSGTAVPRDFVEFPSQFNEHWASYPAVFSHYAKHYKTGAPMPAELAEKIKKSATFNQGYALTEILAAAQLDMQWHTLPSSTPLQEPDAFETAALKKTHLALSAVPPRYRSTYFAHIWGGDYGAGYYAYLWAEMLDDDAFQWFEDHGGLTRANGDRLRHMVLSRGNTEDLANLYREWLGAEPSIEPMLKYRGLLEPAISK
ncbi:MAG TPA: peptidyl-dipeptidase Dcp [Terriglobales bacterium]|jgi:peptidyl-dipeptidase Dcp|nr:peptidyl-dipeptidase Dcp [Terriglobales bacterium]